MNSSGVICNIVKYVMWKTCGKNILHKALKNKVF